MIEVEVKARAREDTKERIAALGATPIGVENHLDLYFNSPLRDFKESDEALRIRANDAVTNDFNVRPRHRRIEQGRHHHPLAKRLIGGGQLRA